MKVIKAKGIKRQAYSLEIDVEVIAAADAAAVKADMSRQKLIEAILRQVLGDPKFVLKVQG